MFAVTAQNIEVFEKETGEKIESGASYVVFGDAENGANSASNLT